MRLHTVRLLFLLPVVPALLCAQAPVIGIVDYYGLRKAPRERVAKALGVKEGDKLPSSKGDVEDAIEQVPGIVRARLEAACCEDGKAILYVGVEERGAPAFQFRTPPTELVKLPEEVHHTYAEFLGAVEGAVRRGSTAEDLTEGHSLMADPDSRAVQQKFIAYAKDNLPLLKSVLRGSYDEEQRAMAAYIIGYAPKKEAAIDDLQYALQDSDDTVRANAMRSLTAILVLARLQPQLGLRISATWLVEMLNSIIWTDRHNATVALASLTETPDPATLALLKERALPALAEMARWKHLPHALPSYILLGRVAGLPEKEVQDLWANEKREDVIQRATAPAPKAKKK